MMYEKYRSLRQDFLGIAESFVDSDVLDQLKHNYAHDIDSKRKLSKVKDLKTLMRLLEKRDIISYDNIEQLWYISKTYIDKPELECKLLEYENWLQTAPPLPAYNMYQSDYTLALLQENIENGAVSEQHNAYNSIYDPSRSSIPNLTTSLNHNTQGSYYPKQEERESNKRQLLQQAVMLEISERLGRAWKDVARHLGIRECEIDATQSKYPRDFKKQTHEILKIYMSQFDREEWVINLIHALEKARRRDLKEFVEKLILKNRDV